MIVHQLSLVFSCSSEWLTHISAILLPMIKYFPEFIMIYLLVWFIHVCIPSFFLQKELRCKPSQFIISNLTSSTLYCLKVQAYSEMYKKTSAFSNVTCIKTAKGMLTFDLKYLISLLAFLVFILSLLGILGFQSVKLHS